MKDNFNTNPEVTIVDYGLGNISAFLHIYDLLGIKVNTATTPTDLCQAKRLIIPGVGAFDWAIEKLISSQLYDKINYLALEKKIPVLGICVGLQIMTSSSAEGSLKGLSWFDLSIEKFSFQSDQSSRLPLPHMGWNTVKFLADHPLWENISDSSRFYFLHSYYLPLSINSKHLTIGATHYGINFSSAISYQNIAAVQFHPEKSHSAGVQLLKNFSQL